MENGEGSVGQGKLPLPFGGKEGKEGLKEPWKVGFWKVGFWKVTLWEAGMAGWRSNEWEEKLIAVWRGEGFMDGGRSQLGGVNCAEWSCGGKGGVVAKHVLSISECRTVSECSKG